MEELTSELIPAHEPERSGVERERERAREREREREREKEREREREREIKTDLH